MRIAAVAAALAAMLVLGAGAGSPRSAAAGSAGPVGELRKEKARLTEMKRKAEAAAAELDRMIGQEKTARSRIEGLKGRLARQRRLIARIDRRLSELGSAIERAEGEIRDLEEARTGARRGIARLSAVIFLASREKACPGEDGGAGRDPSVSPAPRLICGAARGGGEDRMRLFAARAMAGEMGRYEGLSDAKDRKEEELSGIERRMAVSERSIERERRVGEALLDQRRAEERNLAAIEARKKRKEKELKELRSRVARLESVVVRTEKKIRERERARPAGRGKRGPVKFAALPGGLVPPLSGRVVSPFGKRHDPVFDVTVESHGVEIEAAGGSPIRAVGSGEVVFRGSVAGFGKVLILNHGGELYSVYGKAASFTAKEGEDVGRGQVVGALPPGPDGKSVLYLELRSEGTAIDPASVIPLPR